MLLAIALVCASCSSEVEEPGELEIYGPYVGPEADIFNQVLESFEARTGITTSYVGSASFQDDFQGRINSRTLPDISVLPQVALLEPLVEENLLTPLPEATSEEMVTTVGDFWSAIVAPGGQGIAVPYRFVVKSIVWYRPDIFEEEGYTIPETLSELNDLAGQMVRDGYSAWCAGMDSAASTGWWGTDWVEDLVVRNAGADLYWSWALLQTPFTDEAVVSAMSDFQQIVGSETAVNGGRRAVLNVRVEDAIDPMFDQEPGCLMHKQASFQPIWLPDGVEFGDERLDIFPLPGVVPGNPPILISGEIATATSDSSAATRFLEFLLTDAAFQPWLEAGGSLVARAEPNTGASSNELDERLSEMVASAEAVVLDASDLMPQQVGTDVFFSAMIDLVAGRTPTDVATEIQDVVDAQSEG